MLVGALTHVKACRGNLETHNPAAVGNSSSSTSHIGCTRRSPTPAHAVWPMPRPTPVPGQNNLRLSQPANLKKSVCLSVGRPSHCLCREVAHCSGAALRADKTQKTFARISAPCLACGLTQRRQSCPPSWTTRPPPRPARRLARGRCPRPPDDSACTESSRDLCKPCPASPG